MSRFKLAVAVLTATVSTTEAFTTVTGKSTIPSTTRAFVPSPVGSYVDSLSDQPGKELKSQENNELPQAGASFESRVNVDMSTEGNGDEIMNSSNIKENPSISESSDDQVQKKEESPDEKISLTIAAAAKSTLGSNTSRNYMTTRQTLRDSKVKNEKRLSRSVYEQEKTTEKIASIRARMEEQIKNAEKELEEKLSDIQTNFDDEMLRIKSLLASQIKIEKNREEKISSLMTDLEEAISQKNALIQAEDKITTEMMEVRSKLKTGNISSQLDILIDQKRQVATFEQAQLDDLMGSMTAAQTILRDTKDRRATIQAVLDNVRDIDVKQHGEVGYDFSELEKLEEIWEMAAKNAEAENIKILQLKNKFDDELLNKVLLLGDEVPEYLQAAASRLLIRKEAAAQVAKQRELAKQTTSRNLTPSIESSNDNFESKDDYELLGIVAKSLSSAAIDSAKAGVFGIKAVLDTVKEKEGSQKMPTEKDLEQDSIKALGEAGKTVASSVSKSESAVQANNALKETGADLGFAFKAISALGKKAAERLKDQEKK